MTAGSCWASSNKPSLVIVAESKTSRDQLYDIIEHIQARLAQQEELENTIANGTAMIRQNPGSSETVQVSRCVK